jgi:hypothetical protein
MDLNDLPESKADRAAAMEAILVEAATGGSGDGHVYECLRREFMADAALRPLLPDFVRVNRNLGSFWPFIKQEASTYAERRQLISQAFTRLADRLEGTNRTPLDDVAGDALASFDAEGVYAVWTKALERRAADPEGAITLARTLLETVCKRILDECDKTYESAADLPDLYRDVAKALNLAPEQHAEAAIKSILGSAMNVVNGLGTLRNKLSDAHGRGGKMPVRPSPRHAAFAVNMAATVATFLVETFNERSSAAVAA